MMITGNKKVVKVLNFLQRHNTIVPLIIFYASVIFLFAHSHVELSFLTYLSENALSPGVVDNEFYEEDDLRSYLDQLKSIYKNSESAAVQKYLLREMDSIGLDTGVHNYSLNYPELFGVQQLPGANVYGILRSPGTERTEALVFSCWIGGGSESKDADRDANHAGMALMLGLARSFRRRLYWAKDIVFLFNEMHYIGLKAWLDAYHGIASPRLKSDHLPVRSGLIQAALNFEAEDARFKYVNVKMEGLNGILPNLDLHNSLTVLAIQHGVPLRHHDLRTHSIPHSTAAWKVALHSMARMMLVQATGSPNGQHGLFLPFQVPALTLKAVGAGPTASRPQERLGALARTVEGMVRSLNNLQERFHQSFFFYLLPRINRYISIGVYMVPFAGMVAASALQALLLWLDVSKAYESLPESLWWQLPPNLLPCLIFGLVSYAATDYFLVTAKVFAVSPPNGLVGGLLALSVSSLFYPWLLARRTKRPPLADWRFFKTVCLLAQALLVGCLGILNISLGALLSIGLVPVSLLVRPTQSRAARMALLALLLAVHPLSLLVLGVAGHRALHGLPADPLGLPDAVRQALVQGFVEQELLGGWTFRIGAVAVLPVWLAFWGLAMA